MPTKWLQDRTNGSKTAPGMPPQRAFCGQAKLNTQIQAHTQVARFTDRLGYRQVLRHTKTGDEALGAARDTPEQSHPCQGHRAFAVKVAGERLPVSPFSGFDLYHENLKWTTKDVLIWKGSGTNLCVQLSLHIIV